MNLCHRHGLPLTCPAILLGEGRPDTREQRKSSLVIPQQSTSVPEEARVGHQRNICMNNCSCIQMWECKDHAKSLTLSLQRQKQSTNGNFCARNCKKWRDKQKMRNTPPPIRSVTMNIVTAQLKSWHILIGLSQFVAHQLVLKTDVRWAHESTAIGK